MNYSSLLKHWRQGTLLDAVLMRLGRTPLQVRIKYHGSNDKYVAAKALAKLARRMVTRAEENAWALVLGDGDDYHRLLLKRLQSLNVPLETTGIDNLKYWKNSRTSAPAVILSGYPDYHRTLKGARALSGDFELAEVPLEYVAGLDKENGIFKRLDEYSDEEFVSPVLLDDPSPYEIYEESLRYFDQKCGLRDFLDLYQLLKSVHENDIPGDIAEFGSYKGHSGWLIARCLEAFGSDKRLFMFDTFESFPPESLGVDAFWSATHKVDFDEVRSKLSCFNNVQLIKGDFTRTLESSELGDVALAYIDCDSYRATRYLVDSLLRNRLSSRGVLVFEDYGHPALLGNRLAVHESLEGQAGLFRFFSQFSGFYIAVKTGSE